MLEVESQKSLIDAGGGSWEYVKCPGAVLME